MEATGPNPPNLYIKINNSLRYDYGREFFSGLEGTFAKGIAHGNCSPESIPTICTGVTPDEHGVTGFYESPVQTPTIFDLPRVLPEYYIAYFDHPQDPIVRLLDGPPIKKLTDIEPPFIYIERDLATHIPYGTSWNRILAERELTGDASLNIGVGAENTTRGYPDYNIGTDAQWDSAHEYTNLMQEGEVDFFDDYERGCRRARERFTDQMAFLEDRGWLEDTFVVLTADHGEVFGHHDGRPDHWNHTVDCTEVVEVPVLFYGRDVDIDSPVHLEGLLELWWPHWSTIRDGRLEAERKTDTTEMTVEDKERTEDRLRQLGYLE